MLAIYLAAIEDHSNDSKFEELYYQYQSYVMNIALSILRHQQDAEDAAQKTWIAVARNIHKIDHIHSDETKRYITVAIKNHSRNILERNRKNPLLEYRDFHCVSDLANQEEIPAMYETHSRYQRVLEFISNMDDKYRDVLSLYYLEGYKPSKISALLGRPLTTVKSQLKRGKEQILQFYEEEDHHDQ